MPRQQWEKVRKIFEAAKNHADAERSTFVREACENDAALLEQVQRLIEADEQEKDSLDASIQQRSTLPSDPSALTPKQKIDSYRIIKKIGSGGMGDVYLANDTELNRQVALKLLPKEFTRDRSRVRRFQQEARSASQLNHPNILTIHKIGQSNQLHYIVTEFVDGSTLRECLAKGMKLDETIDVVAQIAAALKAAHGANIVHRDIKPENVMVRRDRIVKVLDFGLAKLIEPSDEVDLSAETDFRTQPGFVIGTPLYMSPEQIEGEQVDGRADLFALGSLFYECLTGRQPFQGMKTSDVVRQILHYNPPPPSEIKSKLPPELDFIVLKLLRKNADERYQTADELIADLRAVNSKLKSGDHLATEPLRKNTAPITNANTFSQFIFQPKSRIFLVLSIALVASLIYFSFPKTSSVKPEAQRLFESGAEALRDGTFYKASKMLEDAVKIEPNFASARARLAEAWMELDYVGRAQNELLKANNLPPRQSAFFEFTASDDALYLSAIQATVVRDFPKAVAYYQKIAERHEQEPHVWLDLGRAFEKNEETDRAIECYEKAAALNPNYAAAFLRLGVLRVRKTEYARADEDFERAEKIYDRQTNDEGVAEVKYQRGVSLNLQEKLVAAREHFRQVTNMPRANKYQQIRAMLQISSTFYSEGKIAPGRENALNAINLARAERMENLATNGLIDLGNVYLRAEDYPEAERHFQQALDFARTDNPESRNEARALLSLGSLRIYQNKPEEARTLIEQALPFYQKGGYGKELAQANLLLGQVNELRGDYDGALRAFGAVVQSSADKFEKAYAQMEIGRVLMLQENYPQALRSFEESHASYQTLNNGLFKATTLLFLSDTLCYLGRFAEAKAKIAEVQSIAADADLKELQSKINLQNARIFLAEGDFTKAVETAKQLPTSAASSVSFETDRVACLAQTAQNPKSSNGVQNCLRALQRAEKENDTLKINTANLALAETHLRAGNNAEALKFAARAKDYFVAAGKLESGWRAAAIFALADNSEIYAAQARETLAALKNNWGDEFSQTYVAKPEVRFLLEKLKTFEF